MTEKTETNEIKEINKIASLMAKLKSQITDPVQIIFARHGQTEWNKEYRFQGRTNVKLTETGMLQAKALASRLSSWPVEIIYSSPLDRALFTAKEISKIHNLEPVIMPELEEINFAGWEGQSIPSLEKNNHEIFSRWRSDPFFNPPEGAETWEEIYLRLNRALKIMLESGHKKIIAVSHGGIIRAIFGALLDFNPHKIWNVDVSNCSITGIEIRKYGTCLVFSNDDLHIRAGKAGENLPVWGGKIAGL